jgi:hypothetical protein
MRPADGGLPVLFLCSLPKFTLRMAAAARQKRMLQTRHGHSSSAGRGAVPIIIDMNITISGGRDDDA